MCHEKIVWDSDSETLTCNCGRTQCKFVNPREFHPIPMDRLQTIFQLEEPDYTKGD
jgi:hypothetical protein